MQSDTAGGITEEDVLLPDTSSDIDPDDAENDDRVEEGPAGSTEILRGFQNDRSGPQNNAGTTLNNVSYIDENGVGQIRSSATALSASMAELTPSWYVVSGIINYNNSVILNGSGEYSIILEDGSPAEGSFAATGGSIITNAGYALAVKAVASGVTKLKGITMDGSKKRVTCTVTVRGEVTGVKLLSGTARMKAGSGMTLKPI